MVELKCRHCGKIYFRKPAVKNRSHYCSKECSNFRLAGGVPWNKGKSYKNPKVSIANKGKHYSPATQFQKGIIPWNKGKRTPEYSGEKSPHWTGGTRKLTIGYIIQYVSTGKYVLQHRLVMEKHLGRLLQPQEAVHHINGIKDDNRIENLKLCKTHKEHFNKFHPHSFINKNNSSTQRQCYLCNKIKPLTNEYFGFCKKEPFGFRYECKDCRHHVSSP